MPPRATIAYILKGYPRISETFISNEILLLEQLGFSIRLFSMRHPRESFCHDSVKLIRAAVDYLPTELLFEFHRLLPPNLFLAAKNPGRYRKAMALAGDRFRRNKKIATLKHLLQAGYMTNRFLLNEPDIRHLHGHFAHSPTSVTMFASILSELPFSFTAHAKDIYTSNPDQLREKIDNAGFVVTCTRHNREFLDQLASPGSTPIHCVYHGIDLQLFNQPERDTKIQAPYKLLTIARMTEKKGLPDLYQALALLKEKGLQFEHVLIGDGDDREKILRYIKELDLQEQCKCLGTRTHTEVLEQFRQTDLFVLACKIAKSGDRDGIPNVLVESLAMGVPALSTNVSAIPEILKHGETGYTIEPENPELMAESIKKMLLDDNLRNRISEQGREWVYKQFNNRYWVQNLADIFQAQPHLQAM
jgi:glycosyltransferase involved in cell wall biosynthesis